MKKIIFLLIVTLVFLLTACTNPLNESSNQATSKAESIAESSTPIESKTETSTEESTTDTSKAESVILLRETIHKRPSGTERIVFEYDDQNREISRKTYIDNKLVETFIYGYDENGYSNYLKIINAKNSDYTEDQWINSSTGKMISGVSNGKIFYKTFKRTVNYTYDEKERLIFIKAKDEEDNVVIDFSYEYLDEYGSQKATRVADGVKTITLSYFDAAGNNVETKTLDGDGNITIHIKTEYNEKRNVIKSTKDDIVTTHDWEYDGDKIKKHNIYYNGKLTSTSDYTYNSSSKLIKIVYYDANGKQTQETQYIYN